MTPMLLCRWVQTTAAVLLAGTAVLRLLTRGTGLGDCRAWRRLAWISWGALLVAGVCQFWLTAAAMGGLPLAQALSGEVLGRVLDGTSYGAVWKVRMCLLAVLPAAMVATWDVAVAWLAAAFLASLVWSGHARASAQSAWLLPVDVAHVLAAGAWPGGLVPLVLLLARARRGTEESSATVMVARRFSRLSVVAVGILALSGPLNGIGLIGISDAWWTSVYGRVLLVKAALFAVMVCLGALNRKRLGRDADADPAGTVRFLWRTVAWECALAVGVLLATELLATQAPPV